MLRLACVIVAVTCILSTTSYVIQDENDGKESLNQGAEINKNVVEQNNRIVRRKQNSHAEAYKKKMAHDNFKSDTQAATEESLDSIVLALNTGIKKLMDDNNKSDFLEKYAKQVINLFTGHAEQGHKTKYAEHKYGFKPDVVRFNAEKPSKKFELNAKVLSNLLSDFLKSETFKTNFDNIVKKASVVYRAVQNAGN